MEEGSSMTEDVDTRAAGSDAAALGNRPMSDAEVNVIRRYVAENPDESILQSLLLNLDAALRRAARYDAALHIIRDQYGQVCDEFVTCDHRACRASYGAWETANHALRNWPMEGLPDAPPTAAGRGEGDE